MHLFDAPYLDQLGGGDDSGMFANDSKVVTVDFGGRLWRSIETTLR